MSELIFVTANEYKFTEASVISSELGYTLIRSHERLVEIQTDNIAEIVQKKTRDAYLRVGRPLFVEHTSLHIKYVNGFPGGLTKLFLDTFGDERVCELFGVSSRNDAYGQTTVGYCDGRKIYQFVGQMHGRIVDAPKGKLSGWEQFGWSRIFVPLGHSETLSELGIDVKNKISMRRKAVEELINFLKVT